MSDRLLQDYSHSKAFLVGVWDYDFQPRIQAAQHSLDRMVGALTGDLCQWPKERVTVLENPSSRDQVSDYLMAELDQEAADVALFYFVGHGLRDDLDELCLALSNTRTEPSRRATTGLRFDDVRRALRASNSRVKIVILDCCFAGAALMRPTLGTNADDLISQAQVSGACVIAACGPYSEATFEIDPTLDQPQTHFTKYFIDTLEEGLPDPQPTLTLRRIFDHVKVRLEQDRILRPQARMVDSAPDFAFALNAHPVSKESLTIALTQEAVLRERIIALEREFARSESYASILYEENQILKGQIRSTAEGGAEVRPQVLGMLGRRRGFAYPFLPVGLYGYNRSQVDQWIGRVVNGIQSPLETPRFDTQKFGYLPPAVKEWWQYARGIYVAEL